MQDRPTAAELIEAVREFLESEAGPALGGRTAFHARVAANALAIVGRELADGPRLDREEGERLRALLGRDGDLTTLNAELARRIRDGSLDWREPDVIDHVRRTVRDKLAVANPRMLEGQEGR